MQRSQTAMAILSQYGGSITLNSSGQATYEYKSQTLSWDPYSGYVVMNSSNEVGVVSPALQLMHEIIHAVATSDPNMTMYQREVIASQWEAMIAQELGETARLSYDSAIAPIPVDDPTRHTDLGRWVKVKPDGSKEYGDIWDGIYEVPGGFEGGGGGEGGTGSSWFVDGFFGDGIWLPSYTRAKVGGGYWQNVNAAGPADNELLLQSEQATKYDIAPQDSIDVDVRSNLDLNAVELTVVGVPFDQSDSGLIS